jgi:hypothetical protein
MTMALMPGRPGTNIETKRNRLDVLAGELKKSRQSFESHWRELGEFFRVRRVRLQPSDRNKGDKRNQKIVDSTGVFAADTCAAGLMSGITSPARVWHKWSLTDKQLEVGDNITVWLEDLREATAKVLTRSNFYGSLPPFYGDLAVFATSAMLVEEDDEEVIRCTHFAVGEYYLGYNDRGQVRVFMREFELTVRQIVDKFGERTASGIKTHNLSDTVVSMWKGGQTETGVLVTHIIYENPEHDPKSIRSSDNRFSECYFEQSAHDRFLYEGGYAEWPVMAVAWERTSGDVYGTNSPGMRALPDCKELQKARKMGASAMGKIINPPMIAPVQLEQRVVSLLEGGITYLDEMGDKKVRPAIDTSGLRVDWLQVWIQDLRQMVERAFFVDLFRAISNIDRGDVTATEILEKKEEKLLSLGPVLEQINDGFLDPFFDRVFGIMLRRGLVPEPPEELADVDFAPEYESITAQAQRAQGRSGVDAFVAFANAVVAMDPNDPSPLDKVNRDELIERYAEMSGVPPKMIVADKEVALVRESRAKAQQEAAAAASAEQMAGAANQLAGADMSGDNALTALMGGSDVMGGMPGPVGGM